MKTSHRIFAASLALVLGALPGVAPAQDRWPSKPIRMIVPFTPGSASDVLGRIVAQRLTEVFGQQLVIDNRPGAGGLIGSTLTREAAPDGYTITMVGQPHLSNALLREKKPYDPLKDFTAISLVGTTHNVIVLGKGVNVKTIPDFIALAKAKPGALNYGSAGVGSSSHLAGALFASKAKINVVHVPFRQGPDSRSALIAGTIHYYVYPLPAIMTMLKAGTLKALAVGSPKRAEALPDGRGSGVSSIQVGIVVRPHRAAGAAQAARRQNQCRYGERAERAGHAPEVLGPGRCARVRFAGALRQDAA